MGISDFFHKIRIGFVRKSENALSGVPLLFSAAYVFHDGAHVRRAAAVFLESAHQRNELCPGAAGSHHARFIYQYRLF